MSMINILDVKPGMVLEKSVICPDTGKILLKQDVPLTIKHIAKLKEMKINYVDITDRYTLYVSPIDNMAEKLERDFITYLRRICPPQKEANKNDEIVLIAENLIKLIHEICKNEKILECCIELRLLNNPTTYSHAVNVAVTAGLIAGVLKLSPKEVMEVIMAALVHDCGIAEMPLLANVPVENMQPQQLQLWKEHPTYGYYTLIQSGISRNIAEIILAHHEKFDGSGFPKGTKGEEIPLGARIINVCSHYDTKVTVKGVAPYMAVEELYGASGIYFDSKVINAFVNNIPIYPLGVIVRLSTKEVGIVSNIRKNQGPRPVVKVFYNRVNRPISETKIIDLAVERTILIEEILD